MTPHGDKHDRHHDEGPFADPEVQRLMRAKGIVHRPGMAAEIMNELSPLLAAEGIDVHNIGEDVSLDDLNAAMARATEQRNLTLFTPLGRDRANALRVLFQVSEAAARADLSAATRILDSVDPHETETHPAASHLIGASVGLLDTWGIDSKLGPQMASMTPIKWRGPARKAIRDLLSLARQGRAFDSLGSLIARHGGKAVADGSALAVTTVVLEVARSEGIGVAEAFTRLTGEAVTPGDPPGKPGSGEAFRQRERDPGATLVAEFDEWLHEDPDLTPEDIRNIQTGFTHLITLARTSQLDIHDADDITDVISTLSAMPDEGFRNSSLAIVHEYITFRMGLEPDSDEWFEAHELVEEVAWGDDNLPSPEELETLNTVLGDVLDPARQPEPEALSTALEQVSTVRGARDLLAWIAKPRPITKTGALRRADIQTVAAMIGVHALGSARSPEFDARPGFGDGHEPSEFDVGEAIFGTAEHPVQLQSMMNSPVMDAWWTALITTGIIELTASRVRPGPHAEEISAAGGALDPALGSTLGAVFVAEIIFPADQADEDIEYRRWAWIRAQEVSMILAETLTPEGHIFTLPEDPVSPLDLIPSWKEERLLKILSRAGFLQQNGNHYVAPEALRGVIARGIVLSLQDSDFAFDRGDEEF